MPSVCRTQKLIGSKLRLTNTQTHTYTHIIVIHICANNLQTAFNGFEFQLTELSNRLSQHENLKQDKNLCKNKKTVWNFMDLPIE